MSDAYIIELGEEAVGLVTREHDGYRFYAAKRPFRVLEGRVFDSAETARDAAIGLVGEGAPASALTSLAVAAHVDGTDANRRSACATRRLWARP